MKYTVIPKNPSCGSPVIEADGYTWGTEVVLSQRKVVFWNEKAVVVTETANAAGNEMLYEAEIEIVPGAVLKAGRGQTVSAFRQTVAEFAVDGVWGVVTAKEAQPCGCPGTDASAR